MLAHEKARASLTGWLNRPKYLNKKDEILLHHSLAGFIDQNSIDWKRQYFRNILQLDFIKELVKDGLVDDFIVLKGMSFYEYGVYESFGDRSTSDIDLLVPDLQHFANRLLERGFVLIKSHHWKGNDYKQSFSKIIFGIEVVVELHTRLFFHSNFGDFNKILSKDGFNVLALEDLLVHLVGHLALQHTFLKIHWLLDIYLIQETRREELDMKRVFYLLHELKLMHSWDMTQEFIDMFFKSKTNNSIYNKFIYNPEFLLFPEKNKIKYYLIKHLTKDNPMTSLSYNYYWLKEKGWKK